MSPLFRLHPVFVSAILVAASFLAVPTASASSKQFDAPTAVPPGASLIRQGEVKKRWYFRATPPALSCQSVSCTQPFATVDPGKILVIRHFSCEIAVDEGAELISAALRVSGGENNFLVRAVPYYTATVGGVAYFMIESTAEIAVAAGEEASITARTSSGGIAFGFCGVTGEMLKLK